MGAIDEDRLAVAPKEALGGRSPFRIGDLDQVAQHAWRHAVLPQLAAELLRRIDEVCIGVSGRVLADALANAIASIALLGGVAKKLLAGVVDFLQEGGRC